MTDANIPRVCRKCPNCQRFVKIGVFMPHWTPWEWSCKIDKRPCTCEENDDKERN